MKMTEWIFFVLLVILGGSGVAIVQGRHAEAQCAQFGQANYNDESLFNLPSGQSYDRFFRFNNEKAQAVNQGYYTIGAYKFAVTHYFLDASFGSFSSQGKAFDFIGTPKCPYGSTLDSWSVEWCPKDTEVEIRTLAVKQNGIVMPGWLHFEVELKDKTDEIYAIYVQVRDEFFNAIGEFVTKPEEQCPKSPYLATPSEYQILPCAAVGYREAKISTALFMTDARLLKNMSLEMPYLSTESIKKGIHFTWRLSEYWCNRHLRFRPEAIIFTKKMLKDNFYRIPQHRTGTRVYRKAAAYWIYPNYYGSADIKLDGSILTCDENVIDYKTGKMLKNPDDSLVAPWLNGTKVLESALDNDYMSAQQQYFDNSTETLTGSGSNVNGIWLFKSCQSNPVVKNPTQASFRGRCTHHYEKFPDHDALQGCNLDINSEEFDVMALKDLPTYQDYLIQLTINRTNQCSTSCRVPNNISDLQAIQVYNTTFLRPPTRKPTVIKFVNIGATRNGSKVQKFWAGRKFHGEMLIFWSLFLIPVGTFASRYLKETAMGYPCIGIHIWFWIHLTTTLLGLGMLGCGLLALYDIVNTFGRSLNEFGGYHRGVTTTSIVLFVVMSLIGGIRPMTHTARVASMFVHSLCGFLIYFLNLLGIILSTWIPASPSMPNNCNEEGDPIGFSGIAVVTTIWLVVDLFFHIGMTLLQLWMDKQNEVKRDGFFCPIVPFLPEDSATDMKGKGIRGIMFIVYTSISFIFAMTGIGMLEGTEIDEKCKNLTGPSTYQEVWGCSNWAQAYAEVYPRNPTPAPQAAN